MAAAKRSGTTKKKAAKPAAPAAPEVGTVTVTVTATATAAAPITPELITPDLAPEIAAELQHASAEGAGGTPIRLSPGAIARTLQEIAELLQLTNANTFKVRAYENAARALAGLGEDLDTMLAEGKLDELPGIGTSIAEKVAELARTGKLAYLDELRGKVPAGLVALLRIPGLGPKKAKALHDGLGVSTVEELEAACRAGKLEDLRGFGAKTAENILLGIEQLRRVRGTFLWKDADAAVQPVLDVLRAHPTVQRLEVAGSLRRRKESVHDVDIVLATEDAERAMAVFAGGPWAARLLGSGETKTSIVTPAGLQIDLRAVTNEQYPYALHHFTGSKEHNIAMRGRAIRMGLKMNEYGLWRGETLVPCKDEAEIFKALGLDYVPPELREDQGEIEAAESDELPKRLVELEDLRGALHVHTTWSNGRASILEMARGAKALGWEWIGISDHSQSELWPRGLDSAGLAAQRREIEQAMREVPGLTILHGIEVEIRPNGTLDVEPEALQSLDYVIAGLHTELHLGKDEQTQRLVRALRNPLVTVLAHPTARILVERRAIDLDLAVVIEAAARQGVALEINAHPQRMDLDGVSAHTARDHGGVLSIGPDAHDVEGLENMRFGVSLARRGWLGPEHVLETRSAQDVRAFAQARRERHDAGPA